MTLYLGAKAKCALFISFALLFLAGSASAGEEETPGRAWRRARALMAAGKPEEAHAVYDRLLVFRPGHNIFLIGRARAAKAAGRADDALADYAVLLRKFPDEPALRDEAAEAARLAGNASVEKELGLAPRVVDIRAARLATVLPPRHPAARQSQPSGGGGRALFSGSVRAGILYDSNANQGPASEYFNLGGLDVELPGTGKKSSMAAYLGVNVDFLHALGEGSPWAFVADAALFVRGNENHDLLENKAREWQWGRVGAGVRFLRGNNFLEGRVKAEILDYQLTDNVASAGLELTYARALSDRVRLITQASGDRRIYKRGSFRNADFAQAGQYANILFGERGGHSLMFGGKYLRNRAKDKRPSYGGYELMVRLTASPTERLQLSAHAAYTRERYRSPATVLDDGNRRDNRFRVGLEARYQVNRRLSLEANFQYVKNNSRASFERYTQKVVGGGVAWSF